MNRSAHKGNTIKHWIIRLYYFISIINRRFAMHKDLKRQEGVLSPLKAINKYIKSHKLSSSKNVINYGHVDQELSVETSVKTYKKYFNRFFRDDLYGKYNSEENMILSTGSLDQDEMPLPESLKYFIDYALLNNWYGYSNSLGRESARVAISDMENARVGRGIYSSSNISLIKGVTSGLSNLLTFLKEKIDVSDFTILTHLPTYMPFATACEKIAHTKFINLIDDGAIDINRFSYFIDRSTKIILLLADFNPLGKILKVDEINRLIKICNDKGIYLIIDEGGAKFPSLYIKGLADSPYLIRMESLSKKISVPGMKLGYFVADKSIVREYYETASTCYGGPASFFYLLQEIEARFNLFMIKGVGNITTKEMSLFDENYHLSKGWLQFLYDDYLRSMGHLQRKLDINRLYIFNEIEKISPTLIKSIIYPETGVNIFINLNTDMGSYEFFEKLLLEKRVSIFPGICSGLKDGCWIRITSSIKTDTLANGLKGMIAFLKEEYIRNIYKQDDVLGVILDEYGRFNQLKELSFNSHIYDVLDKINYIKKNFPNKKVLGASDDTLVDAIFCHDAGKVINVIMRRMFVIFDMQSKYRVIPTRILRKYRDQDLLWCKNKLDSGTKLDVNYFINKFPFIEKYIDLANWKSCVPPKDDVITIAILNMFIRETDDGVKKERAKKILKILDTKSLRNGDVASIMLDVADKLADYELPPNISLKEIRNKIIDKKKYAINKYGLNDKNQIELIRQDFDYSIRNLNKLLF